MTLRKQGAARGARRAKGGARPLVPLTGAQQRQFQRRLLVWFRMRQRPLPWRETRDPYRIWISEVMLQQTRVAAVLPYYQRFLARFPSVRALARARHQAVLKAWAGLGYYSRARNLQRAAQEIVRRHGGRFPRALEAALGLPGVGRYTAAAVLSIAYGAPLAVLDGNVARVLARLGAVRSDARSDVQNDLRRPARWRQLESAAQVLLPPRAAGAPGAWNQAMMELGATICTPRAPACHECPVAQFCRARALGLQEKIPGKRVKRAPVSVRLAAAVLLDPYGRTLLVRPEHGPGDGLFSRMWQFPAVEVARGAESKLRRHLRESLGIEAAESRALAPERHTVTFRRITLLPFLVSVEELPKVRSRRGLADECMPIALAKIESWPTSSATRKIARAALRAGQPA